MLFSGRSANKYNTIIKVKLSTSRRSMPIKTSPAPVLCTEPESSGLKLLQA